MRTLMFLALLTTTLFLTGCGGEKKPENPDTTDPNMATMPGDE